MTWVQTPCVQIEIAFLKYLNKIVFEAGREGITCSGTLHFNSSEKLVFAERELGDFEKGSEALSLAHILTTAINSLVPSAAVKLDENHTGKFAMADLQLHVLSGPGGSQKTLFITVDRRTVKMEVNDGGQSPFIRVTQSIGDMHKGDWRSVPVKK